MWEWEDARMKLLLISIVGVVAAAAFAQQNPAPTRRSPEQIFEFLDKDKNGTLSEAEFGALKDKMPTLRDRPDGVSAKFKELDKDQCVCLDKSREKGRAIILRAAGSPASVSKIAP